MATVAGVTEETTVVMETASQWAIFASRDTSSPSLIGVDVWVCVCFCVFPHVCFLHLVSTSNFCGSI